MSNVLLLLPFATLIVLNLLPRGSRGWAWIACLVIFGAQTVLAALYPFGVIDWSFMAPVQKAIGFNVSVDNLGVMLLVTAGIAGIAAICVASASLKKARGRFIFANMLLIALIGIDGIALVRDLFSLYVFIEVTSICAFILVAFRDGQPSLEGAWKYLILSAVASVFLLTSIGCFLLSTGGISFDAVIAGFAAPTPLMWVAGALFLCGLFVKGAMVPFHGWLADAYAEAPPAVSVFFAGIVTKASGIFALMRLGPALMGTDGPAREILLVVGTVSAVVGAFLALTQTDMKRMLAYSSVSQMGYIVLALGGNAPLALIAAGVHFFNHTISKAQLFTNAAAIEESLGTRDMDRMGGLSSRMPFTGATAVIGTLSIAGLPPLAGFWSKLLIVIALWQAGQVVFAVIAILTSVITLAYFLSLQRRVFFGKIPAEWEGVKEAGIGYIVPAVALAAITVAVGLGFPFLLRVILGGGV